jgi:hypothetical protein
MQPYELPFDFKETRKQFDEANQLARELDDQNSRSDRLDEVRDPEFRGIAREGLVEEQTVTVSGLRAIADAVPYEHIARVGLELSAQIGEATLALDGAKDRLKPELSMIDQDAARASQISPNRAAELAEIAERRKNQLELHVTGVDRAALSKKRHWLDAIHELYERSGPDWPVPRVLLAEQLSVQSGADESAETEIPVHAAGKRTFEGYLERHEVERPAHSHYVAYYLSQHPDQVVSVDELGQMLASAGLTAEGTDRQLRNRVSTMLGPKQQGQKIQKLIEGDGLVLQYGTQIVYGPDRQTVIEGQRRAYRAIHPDHPEYVAGQEFEMVVIKETESQSVAEPPEKNAEAPETLQTKSWQEALQDKVELAISHLKADGLMSGRSVELKKLRLLSSSAKLGTKEAVIRMAKAGLLPEAAERSPEDVILTPVDVVLMYIQNSTPELSKQNRRLQHEALDLVKKQVVDYLERLEEQVESDARG